MKGLDINELVKGVVAVVSYTEFAATLGFKEPPKYDFISFYTITFNLREELIKFKESIIVVFMLLLEGRKDLIDKIRKDFNEYFLSNFKIPGPQNADHLIELFEGSIKLIMLLEEEDDIINRKKDAWK